MTEECMQRDGQARTRAATAAREVDAHLASMMVCRAKGGGSQEERRVRQGVGSECAARAQQTGCSVSTHHAVATRERGPVRVIVCQLRAVRRLGGRAVPSRERRLGTPRRLTFLSSKSVTSL